MYEFNMVYYNMAYLFLCNIIKKLSVNYGRFILLHVCFFNSLNSNVFYFLEARYELLAFLSCLAILGIIGGGIWLGFFIGIFNKYMVYEYT